MNSNNRKPGNGKLPAGLFIGIIFFILSVAPLLIPLIIVAAIGYFAYTKGTKGKFNSTDNFKNKNSDEIKSVDGKLKDIQNIIVSNDESNLVDYKNKTETQKRLEMLKMLYVNGFMERDEYEEKRKKMNDVNLM